MKILICDYEDELKRQLGYEKDLLIKGFAKYGVNNVEICVYPYKNEIDLCEKIKEFDVLLTAFIPINKKVLDCALNLKCISVNATGYGNIDVDEATKRNIAVCNVKEYCTKEVAEHTMALMLSMLRMLKHYGK